MGPISAEADLVDLATHEISVSFDGVVALSSVSLRLARGEILGLIGPNGAGKTTLLNVLSGFQRPSSGTVTCGGRPLTAKPPAMFARSGVSRTFQNVRVFPALTVLENVELGALGQGVGRREARKRAWTLLETFGLTPQAQLPALSLPYGQERMLGIARALAQVPAFLLLDEPAAGLNSAESAELVARISNVQKEHGCGVLVVEHDMHLIMALSERIHVLDYGRTIAEGSPTEVRSDPTVIAAYFGTSRTTEDSDAGG
jgi:branched-chain amino acid transport system ATP-binding protein